MIWYLMNTKQKIRPRIINEHLISFASYTISAKYVFLHLLRAFFHSLASSIAVLRSSLVIMTVFGLNCCPPASPTSAQLFIELHSSSIPLHLSLLLSPSLYLHLFLCRHRPHLDGSARFFQSLSLSVSTHPSNSLIALFFILLLLPTQFCPLLANFSPHNTFVLLFTHSLRQWLLGEAVPQDTVCFAAKILQPSSFSVISGTSLHTNL